MTMKKLLLSFAFFLPTICLADTFTEYSIPTALSSPTFIVERVEGEFWFTQSHADSIAKLDVETGTVTEFDLPNVSSTPWGIALGPDGNIWFTERDGDRIGKITSDGTITEYNLTVGSEPYQIIADNDQGVLWFTEYGRNRIAKITTNGSVTEFVIPTLLSNPTGLTKLNDDIWFCEETGNKIGRFRSNETFSEYAITTAASLPNLIITDSSGKLWFTMKGVSKIGTITEAGAITEFSTTTPASGPISIVEGPLGTPLWFTEGTVGQIGKIGVNGTMVSEQSLPTGSSGPFSIILGSDEKLWVTEKDANKIVRITPTDFLTITSDSGLPDGLIGTAYSKTITASGGSSPYTYQELTGDGFMLPPGLSFSASGVLSGTPTASGNYIIRVKVTDSAGISVLKGFSVIIPELSLPDLRARISLTSRGTVKDAFKITVVNQGSADSQSVSLRAYASANRTIDGRDKLLLDETIASLPSAAKSAQQLKVNRSLRSTKQYLIICVNCDELVTEETSLNNRATAIIQ